MRPRWERLVESNNQVVQGSKLSDRHGVELENRLARLLGDDYIIVVSSTDASGDQQKAKKMAAVIKAARTAWRAAQTPTASGANPTIQ